MRKAVEECISLRTGINPQLLIRWCESLCNKEPDSLLCVDTDTFKNTIIPAFLKLRPENSYYTNARPELGNVNPGRARLTLSRFLEATERRPHSFCGPTHAEEGVPLALENVSEVAKFIPYSEALLNRKSVKFIVVLVEFADNVCFVILVDLVRCKLEVVSCVHDRLTFQQAKEMEDALVWFSLFQFHKRVQPVRSIKIKPQLHLHTLAIALYLMLRLHYSLSYESAAMTCTLPNLQRFIGHIDGTCTEDIQVKSNLMFGN